MGLLPPVVKVAVCCMGGRDKTQKMPRRTSRAVENREGYPLPFQPGGLGERLELPRCILFDIEPF